MTSKVYYITDIEPLCVLALAYIQNKRDALYEKGIIKKMESLHKYRKEKAKFGLFNWFPKKYVAPTREDGIAEMHIGDYWVDSEYDQIYKHRFTVPETMIENVLKLCRSESRASDEITVSAEDYAAIERYQP